MRGFVFGMIVGAGLMYVFVFWDSISRGYFQ